ncbi:MAG TPA: chorismate synthase, partial [Candidatus Cloacimonetes bacterium]|nr:chorismate synthase [Candidatus Cloacimonadota bacterium]
FEGKTTGMPLCIIVRNTDHKSADYSAIKDIFRPGHADFSWFSKYLIHDYRGGGRSSGRETLARVIASKLSESILGEMKIIVTTLSIGEIVNPCPGASAKNPHHWTDIESYPKLLDYLDEVKADKDSVGGVLGIRVTKVPTGLGDPIYEKLSANIAKAMLSIGTVRGILFGDGKRLARAKGSQVNDRFLEDGTMTNHHGGIIGGISTGQDIYFELYIRPVSSIGKKQSALTKDGEIVEIELKGRHDSCHIPRIIPVVEAMLKLVLADAVQAQKLIDGSRQDLDGFRETLDKLDEELLLTLYRRREVVRVVKEYKLENSLPARDMAREEEIMDRAQEIAKEYDLDPELVQELIKLTLRICAK